MTHEEMIEQLENTILLIRQNGKDWWDERDIPILEEAIKAMKTEPCEDTISRRAAVSVANDFDCGMVVRGLEKLSSVQPEQKIGHWITLKDEYGDIVEAVCSKCEKNGNHKWAYCSNCGAKMVEKEDAICQ